MELRNQFQDKDQNSGIAYLYLRYKKPQSAENLLESIVKQLVGDAELSRCGQGHRLRQGFGSPTLIQLTVLLSQFVAKRHVYIVATALDECREDIRARLIDYLETNDKNVSLVTSRILSEF